MFIKLQKQIFKTAPLEIINIQKYFYVKPEAIVFAFVAPVIENSLYSVELNGIGINLTGFYFRTIEEAENFLKQFSNCNFSIE